MSYEYVSVQVEWVCALIQAIEKDVDGLDAAATDTEDELVVMERADDPIDCPGAGLGGSCCRPWPRLALWCWLAATMTCRSPRPDPADTRRC